MPQLTAMVVLWLSKLKRSRNGPASQRAASMTALTSSLDWLAPRTTSRMPMTTIAATPAATSVTRRASAARAGRPYPYLRSRKVLMPRAYPAARFHTSPFSSLLPLDRAADRLGLGALRLRAREHRVERLAQPRRVQRPIPVVGVGRAATGDPSRGVDHEAVGRRLGVECVRDLLALVVEVGHRPVAVGGDALAHRVEGVARVALGVVGVDREDLDVGVVARDGGDPVVPRQRVRAVVAGEDDERRRRIAGRMLDAVGVGQRERGGFGTDCGAHEMLLVVMAACRASRTSAGSGTGEM